MTTKEEYIDALRRMEGVYYNFDGCMSLMNKFKEDINLLTGLVNEHFEEKQAIKSETNIEHYLEYLSEVGLGVFALVNGRFTKCSGTRCSKCDFSGDCSGNCNKKKLRWLASPYKKPKYKLTKIEHDLLYTNNRSHDRKLSSFVTYKNLKKIGYFKYINFDLTINEILNNCEVKEDE